MDYKTYSEKLEYLLYMIKNKQIDSPKQIAEKFGCCEKTARTMVNSLRDMGHDIYYSRSVMKYILRE